MRVSRLIGVIALVLWCRTDAGTTAPPDATEGPDTAAEHKAMVWPDEDFRYAAPEPSEARPMEVPPITRFELANGIEAYLVERHQLPTVSMTLSFATGSVADPPRKRGMTSLCMQLLEEGTKRLDKVAFEERKADLAATVSAFANRETMGIGVAVLRPNLEAALDLAVEMLLEPGLRPADLERLRARQKASLQQTKAAPASLGRHLWPSIVFGPQHPYGRVTTEASIDAVTVGDCKKLLAKLAPKGARLFVAGDVTEAEVRSLLESRLARWRGKAPAAPTLPPPAPREGSIFLVDVPGAAQSQIYVGHPGPARTASDYEPTLLMAQILGGSFSSRINMNLRETHGYAYGARAQFTYRRDGSVFAASSSVRSDATGASLREIAEEIERMRAEMVEAAELERERQGTLQRLPALFATARSILDTYADLVFYGLPLDWYEGHQRRIDAVKAEDVLKAARSHLWTEDVRVLVVGDRATIGAELEAIAEEHIFGTGGLVVLDPDGNVERSNASRSGGRDSR